MAQKSQRNRLLEQLSLFGCSQKEAAIYLHCLEMGESSVQDISRRLGINRVTVHSACEQLLKKGILSETRRGKGRRLLAESPAVFGRLLQQQENELNVKRSQLDELTTLLQSMPTRGGPMPTVRFLEGVDGFKRMLEETLSAKGEVFVFTYVDLFSKLIGPDYLEDYFKRRAAKGIHTRLIFPPCPFVNRVAKKAKQYLIKVRLLPPEFKWQAGIFSWNNCLSLKSFTQGQITCTIVENEDLAHFYQNVLFELAWKQASLFTELEKED